MYRMLIINPGSTSTKIAIFSDLTQMFVETIRHSDEEISSYETIFDQYDFRKNAIEKAVNERGIDISSMDAIVGRGGNLRPVESGTYDVNESMLKDLQEGLRGQHASTLGGIIAYKMYKQHGIKNAFVVDPVTVDELEDLARISGHPDIVRRTSWHALNQKAVSRRYAKEIGKSYEEINLIVAHMGGGISVGAHRRGKVIDVNNALDGDGAFSPERSGGLPVGELVKMCFSNKYTYDEMKKKIAGKGGLAAYINTNDAREVEMMIAEGNKLAETVYEAMAYQVSKDIGICATVLKGEVDAVILTGGIAYSKKFINWIKERVSFIADVVVYAGEDEMLALAEGGYRVLTGEEAAKEY